MTEPQHSVDPSDISVGSSVTFSCPLCPFSFRHVWLPLDGSQFGNSHCYAHFPPLTMVITKVEPPEPGEESPPSQ